MKTIRQTDVTLSWMKQTGQQGNASHCCPTKGQTASKDPELKNSNHENKE